MAAGLPDLVDCARLALDAAVIERVFALGELPRLQDVLAEPEGTLRARFAFARAASGRARARVAVDAVPQLKCQRCMQGFALPLRADSEVEFTDDEESTALDPEREYFLTDGGMVSLRELAEEEFLLALPIVTACRAPQSCGQAPPIGRDAEGPEISGAMRRPFTALQDMMKKP